MVILRPVFKANPLWLRGLAFLFGQPTRRSPDHHTNSAGAWEGERERLDWSPVAIFSNLSAPPNHHVTQRKGVCPCPAMEGGFQNDALQAGQVHSQHHARVMPEPWRPREGSGSRQLTRDRWHSPPPTPSQQRLQKAPEATVDLLSIPTPTPAHKVTAKVEAKMEKKKNKKKPPQS